MKGELQLPPNSKPDLSRSNLVVALDLPWHLARLGNKLEFFRLNHKNSSVSVIQSPWGTKVDDG